MTFRWSNQLVHPKRTVTSGEQDWPTLQNQEDNQPGTFRLEEKPWMWKLRICSSPKSIILDTKSASPILKVFVVFNIIIQLRDLLFLIVEYAQNMYFHSKKCLNSYSRLEYLFIINIIVYPKLLVYTFTLYFSLGWNICMNTYLLNNIIW